MFSLLWLWLLLCSVGSVPGPGIPTDCLCGKKEKKNTKQKIKDMGFILNLLLHEPLRKTRKKKIYGKHYMEIKGQRSLGIWERLGNEESTHRHLSAYGNAKRV